MVLSISFLTLFTFTFMAPKILVVVPPPNPRCFGHQVAPTYPVHNVADLAVPKKRGGEISEVFLLNQKIPPFYWVHAPYRRIDPYRHSLWPMGKVLYRKHHMIGISERV